MTRKDFELIAYTIRNSGDLLDEAAIQALAARFADDLQMAHPRFDRRRFINRATATQAKREAITAQL